MIGLSIAGVVLVLMVVGLIQYKIKEVEEKELTNLAGGSTSDKQWEFLKDVALLIQYANDMGYKLTGGELQRTVYQQKRYIAIGKSWTMNSQHIKKLAIDLNLFIGGVYQTNTNSYKEMGIYWESLNQDNRWGGRFRDGNHFERMSKSKYLKPLN